MSKHSNFGDMTHWGFTTSPVPGVPLREYKNLEAFRTIELNPGLFQVNCSLNIDQFQELLNDHPNWVLIDSVCLSLHEGFWPYANSNYPTLDMSSKGSTLNKHLKFIGAQVKVKVTAGRYSTPFGPKLLPSPVHAVPKVPDTFCLINDQSYGDHSLNFMILREDIARTCMDRIRSLGTTLLQLWWEFGDDIKLIMYQSNISHAYQNFWVHLLWQIKQIV